ncbi:hypothetical protein ILUMI_03460 [Ignelater luminosus]|uniref:PiggyBac transposable element-derived protein domain-containing protein n=1 Tax=Ignelater luminosus TaxID=2038154 RepID=A0A8K0GIB1_IGNLU|nr:hypothetical protein ILUMI_03460 [Ignelater luminosus]
MSERKPSFGKVYDKSHAKSLLIRKKKLEEIVRAYKAEETDSENVELQSDESESDDHESAKEMIEDEIVSESESDSEDDLPLEHLKSFVWQKWSQVAFRAIVDMYPFKMYIPNKPDKYGIKIVMLCDSKTFYMLNSIAYVVKEERKSSLPIPTQYVLKLTEPLHGTNRNVTVDNWFTSVPLAIELLNHGLTLVGSLRHNKPEILPEFLKKKFEFPSTMYAFDNTKTIALDFPKRTS